MDANFANQSVGASGDPRFAKKLERILDEILKEGKPTTSKPKLEWAENGKLRISTQKNSFRFYVRIRKPWSGPLGADKNQAADLTIGRGLRSSNCCGLR
jgi:hypothetical protein